MAQIRESQFAVMRINEEDIDLLDLANQTPVCVETEHQFYDSNIISQIEELVPGDVINAQIQGEDILQPNSIWRFLEFDVVDNDPMFVHE